MLWTLPLKIAYSTVVSCIFVVPAIVGYALHIKITEKSFWALGVYGTIVFVFILLQLLFATLNRVLLNSYRKRAPQVVSSLAQSTGHTRPATPMGLAVVGYREEPGLFLQCLESIQRLEYPDPIKIAVVIDGMEAQDAEMAAIFEKAFPNCPVVVLPQLMSEPADPNVPAATPELKAGESEKDMPHMTHSSLGEVRLPTDTQAVCYLQPHRGKRHAMYTAFKILMAAGCDAIMSTDSDTRFDSKALLEMENALYWHPNIGAAAGDVRIWNTDSLLSFMSSLRYWMAFNIERASQSFNRCVTCISGPMGIYRSHVLAEVLDDWIRQRFLGMECTYGDDRHLTNQVLRYGYRAVYTHHAFCETETPTQFLRWFKQQTRWSKSFYRELFWNAQSIHKHSPWMAAELFYQGVYPFVLIFSIFSILWTHSPFALGLWLVSLLTIACIKTFYSLIVTRNPRFLAFPAYSVYYLIGLVPAKLWALLSLWDVGWGTSARSAAERKLENVFWPQVIEALPIIFWFALIIAGVVYNIAIYFFKTTAALPGSSGTTFPDPTSIFFIPNPN